MINHHFVLRIHSMFEVEKLGRVLDLNINLNGTDKLNFVFVWIKVLVTFVLRCF
jgi:hypothetical protein